MLEMLETEITHIDFGGVCGKMYSNKKRKGSLWTMGFYKYTIYCTSLSDTDLTIKKENEFLSEILVFCSILATQYRSSLLFQTIISINKSILYIYI